MYEAGAVRGLDALSDTTIGTGLPFLKCLVSLPEEEPVRADRLKAEALIEFSCPSIILSREENQQIECRFTLSPIRVLITARDEPSLR